MHHRAEKENQILLFSPQPPTRRDFHREAEDKPACRQPRFLRFPSVNYFFLFFSVLRCALLHLTILSSLDLPYPILSYPILPWVATWLTCGCHLVVIPQNGLWSGEGGTGGNWNTQRGVQNKKGVLPTGAVPVAAEGGTTICTEPCGKSGDAVPPQAKDRCQSERDGVLAPIFLVKPT